MGTAVAAITLMAPAAFHRISAPAGRHRLKASIRLQIAGDVHPPGVDVGGRVRRDADVFGDTAIGVVAGRRPRTGLVLWYALLDDPLRGLRRLEQLLGRVVAVGAEVIPESLVKASL